jgi:hypothetical protein
MEMPHAQIFCTCVDPYPQDRGMVGACRKSNSHIQMMKSAKKWRRQNATNGMYCSRRWHNRARTARLRLCRTEFSVHTGLGLYHPYQKDAVRKSSVIRRTAKASRSEIESFDRSRGRRNHLHKYIRFCHRQRTALSATDKRRAICYGIELCTRGMSG